MRKSIRSILSRLLNFVHLDSSYTRDKVSRAAGRRSVGSVFCSPLRKCTVTSKLRFHYRDSDVIGFYRDKTPCVHLPGLAKNSPTPTQTAPNYTTEPLAFMVCLADNDRKTEVDAVIKMEVGPPQVSYRRDLQTAPRCFLSDWEVLNGWGKSPVKRIR
jgi:hypothetical protein